MEERTDIDAVELVRHIRDQQAKLLQGMSNAEIIEFFRKAGEASRKRARSKRRAPASKRLEPPTRKARRG
jgi:hypothetical protein